MKKREGTMKIFSISFVLMMFISAAFAKPEMNKKNEHEHGKERMMKHLDTDKDGKISADEWNAMFKKIDKNGDGFATKEEFKEHHQMMKDHMMKMKEKK